MTYELDEISQRINAAEAYAADAQQILGDSGDPLARIAAASTLATIATAQLMHRIAGSAALNGAQTEAKTPQCDDQTVLMLAPGSPVVCVCILDDGHGRIHQDADGRTWERTTMDTEPASRAVCGSVHTLRNSGNTVVCTRQSGHDAPHSNGDGSWFDDCGNPFSWDPEYTCEKPAGHDGPHSAAGYRWGDGYCLNVYPTDRSRLCVLDRGHTGMCSDHTVTWDAEPVTSDGHVHGVTAHHIARHLETIARAVRGGRVTSRDVINLTSVTQSLAQIVTRVTPSHVPAAAAHYACASDCNGVRCERPSGHVGMHYGDGSNWRRSPTNPDSLRCQSKDAGSALSCVLPETHHGPHVDDDFCTWGNNTYKPCENAGDDDKVCERQTGHNGDHRHGDTLWS